MTDVIEQVLIRGNIAVHQSITETYTRAEDMFADMAKKANYYCGPLPLGTKFFVIQGENQYLIMEHSPRIIPCRFDFTDECDKSKWKEYEKSYLGTEGAMVPDYHNHHLHPMYRGYDEITKVTTGKGKNKKTKEVRKNVFSLGMPYSIYIMKVYKNTISDFYYAWAYKPLEDFNSYIYLPYLPNINNSKRVCMGDDFSINTKHPIDIQALQMIEAFWTRGFNKHLWDSMRKLFTTVTFKIKTVQQWEDLSESKGPLQMWENVKFRGGCQLSNLVGSPPE